jgi:hypothetical protein
LKESRAHRILCQFGILKNLAFCDTSKHTAVLQSKISLGILTVCTTGGHRGQERHKMLLKGKPLTQQPFEKEKMWEKNILILAKQFIKMGDGRNWLA